MNYQVIKIDENTWRIEDGMVRFFLLAGDSEALLIDSGMQVSDAKGIAEKLTSLPIKLLNTHCDMDHICSNYQFDTFYMHPAEASNYYNTNGGKGSFTPVYEGDIIDLGSRPLEIISLAGHTPGSIGVLDINKRVLFSGDPIQDGMIFMMGIQREIHSYIESLKRLDKIKDRFDLIYPSHGTLPVGTDMINGLRKAAEDIIGGKYLPMAMDFHNQKINCYDVGIAKFLMDIK